MQFNLILLLSILLFLPQPAHAYIDPSAGGYIVQVVFGVFLSASMVMKSWFSAKKGGKKI